MEVLIWLCRFPHEHIYFFVSILVLMEVLIWSALVASDRRSACGFNPCSDGSTDLVECVFFHLVTLATCFNPCSDGSTDLVLTHHPTPAIPHRVSILVLMEVLIWFAYCHIFPVSRVLSFNPCSDGSTDLVCLLIHFPEFIERTMFQSLF